jgi:hypothetical protein
MTLKFWVSTSRIYQGKLDVAVCNIGMPKDSARASRCPCA